MLKILVLIMSFSLLVSAEAAQRHKRTIYVPTEQERRDQRCSEYDLGWAKESPQNWKEYQKDCAPRTGHVETFWKVAEEYKKQCTLSKRLNAELSKSWDRKERITKDRQAAVDTESIKCDNVEWQVHGHYVTLYELERQQVFSGNASLMRDVVGLRCPNRKTAKDLRHAFARCHIHTGPQEMDGYYAWVEQQPKSVHTKVAEYENSLKKRGLWIEN